MASLSRSFSAVRPGGVGKAARAVTSSNSTLSTSAGPCQDENVVTVFSPRWSRSKSSIAQMLRSTLARGDDGGGRAIVVGAEHRHAVLVDRSGDAADMVRRTDGLT